MVISGPLRHHCLLRKSCHQNPPLSMPFSTQFCLTRVANQEDIPIPAFPHTIASFFIKIGLALILYSAILQVCLLAYSQEFEIRPSISEANYLLPSNIPKLIGILTTCTEVIIFFEGMGANLQSLNLLYLTHHFDFARRKKTIHRRALRIAYDIPIRELR